jgi:NTE family protein
MTTVKPAMHDGLSIRRLTRSSTTHSDEASVASKPSRRTGCGRRACTLVAAFGLAATLQHAQAADPPAVAAPKAGARPRIGLVLGGGGAKGAAHVGVIKVLEELRVPVDCIAGTSMGSIVGAAYATGLSADQLERVMTSVNWKDILATAPRHEVPVQRKRQDFAFPLGLELGVRDGDLIFPAGLVPTHQIEALFRRIVAGAGQVSDFDRLPIPFRAVSTDLATGQMVVFDRGDLSVAMRASMAVPGAFAPVEADGAVLVDGMLVRNLPVDVARKTCADVVIAVPLGNPAVTRDKLNRLTNVAGQAMNIAVEANEKVQIATLRAQDVQIPVLLKDIGSADFSEVPRAIPIGEAAAREAAGQLARYSLSPEAYARWRAGLREVAALPRAAIDEVRMTGFEVTNPKVMRTFVEARPGDTYDPAVADADATRIAARGDFAAVSSQLSEQDGKNVLTYKATEKPWGPDYLTFALNLSTDLRGDTGWGIRLDYQKRWLNALGGELRTSVQVGRPNGLLAEYYQPLDPAQRYFVSPLAYVSQTLGYVYSGAERIAELDTSQAGLRLDGGIAFGSWGEARAGLLFGRGRASTSVAVPWLPDQGTSRLGAVALRATVDTLDKRLFPSEGTLGFFGANLSDTALGAESTYQTAYLRAQKTLSGEDGVWTLTFRGGSDFGSGAEAYDQFRAGGLGYFSGYHLNELTGRAVAFASLGYRRRIGWIIKTLETGSWLGGTVEAGNVFRRLDGTPASGALIGGSIYVAVDTPLGPIYLAYGLSQGGRSSFYLNIGSSLEALQ